MPDNRVIPPVPSDYSYENSNSDSGSFSGSRENFQVDYLNNGNPNGIPAPGTGVPGNNSFSNSGSGSSNGSFADSGVNGGALVRGEVGIGDLDNFTLLDLVEMFVTYAFIIAAALSAIFIFIGGISFILSGGNDEKVKQAVNTIRYSIIGLIVTILSFTFVTIVGRIFGLDFMNYLSYAKIKGSIERVLKPVQNSGDNGFNIQG